MRRLFISALTAIYCSALWAINGISIIQNTIGSGLESQSINILAKDRQGRLWVGSDVGLSLISNGTVTNIRELVSEGGMVMLSNVNSIVCTESILLSCEDRILHYDHKNHIARTLRNDGLILHTDYLMLQGNIAIFYDNELHTLFSYNMDTSECSPMGSIPGNEDYSFAKILCGSDSSVIYLADNIHGLYRYDRRDGSFEKVPGTDSPIVAKATTIDQSNVIWLSVPSQGIKGYYINSDYEKVGEYNTHNCDLLSDDVSYMTELPNGNLFTAHSDNGTCVIERKRIETGKVSVNVVRDLKDVTTTLVNSQDQETLFGTSGYGLISMKKTFIGQIRHLNEHENGMINFENYISIYEEPEGTVIMATQNDGLYRINPFTHEKNFFEGTKQLEITAMCRFDDRNILMYDPSDGFYLFNLQSGRVFSLPADNAISTVLSNKRSRNVHLISTDEDDIFIFNADSRHYVYRKENNTLAEFGLQADDGTPVKSIENCCITPYAIYVTFRGTIMELDFNTLKCRSLYRNKERVIHNITSISANSKGELFFTEPEGLHRFDPHSDFDELLVETWGNGRFMNVAVDMKDRVWFTTTNEYLQMFDPANRELLLYSVEDGVPDARFLNNFSICTKTGIVLFPNANGVVAVNTNGSLMYDSPPVEVTCISAATDKKSFSKSEIDNSLQHPFKLSSRFRELNLEFSANAFNPTYPHLLIYNIYKNDMLVMSTSTTNTSITIPQMDNGIYSVSIRQAYRKGLSDPVTILKFKIPKPFPATIPGVLLSLLILLAFGYTIARFSSSMEKNRMEKALAAQDIKNREDKIAFLSNIAHELRTPLSLIYNPVKDFLQEKSVDGIDYERMERIFNQVNKMTVMVNMILDSSRADVNKADILVEEVNLNEWLNFLLEDYRIDCYGKGFSLKFIMDNSIGTILIDKRIIETGLSNMVNNAIKYSTSGTTITVSTSRAGDMIRVSVKDQGHGFTCDPEDLFKRYYRENTDTSIPGYGLGLPYARLQLSLIGGNMWAKNNEDGVGSTFYMDFPPSIGKNGVPVKTGNNDMGNEDTQEGMAQDFDTNNMTVLFVNGNEEENISFQDDFNDIFRQVLTAKNGIEALSVLKHTDVDIVISDADLPDSDGFELCRSIKWDLEISHIPIILLTSRTDKRNKEMGYKMGADAFIPKPFDKNQMYAIIRSQLGGRFEIKRQYNFRFFDKISQDQTFSITDEQFIITLHKLIEESMSDPGLNEESILQKMNLTHSVMTKKMDGLLGTDIMHYLNRIKIGVIKDMLSNTDEPLESIARQTGFMNVESMNKAFMRETGKTVFAARAE